jgi:hypothetical protein
MNSQLLVNAKRDIPLYFKDFKSFWDATTLHYTDSDLINCYKTSLIFKNWLISLNHVKIKNLDSILKEVHEDINASFFHSYFGHYRSAHMHLRSVIELSLQLLYFFQHEIEFSQWKVAEFRIKHEELTSYLKKHPNLRSTSAITLIDEITKNWKLFSKYIHAEAPVFFQTSLQSSHTKQISRADFGRWKSNYLKTGYQVNKLFLLFFNDKINSFPTQTKELLLSNMRIKDVTELGFA